MLLLVLMLISIVKPSFSQNLDIRILRAVNGKATGSSDRIFEGITNSAAPLSVSAPAIIFAIGAYQQSKNKTKQAVYLTETMLVSSVFVTALKYSINRKRPFEKYSDIIKKTDAGSPSFPSGHTSLAFSTATSLSLCFPKWYVIVPSYLWAGAVGYSRMYLGVHYPSDALAGALIGAGSAWITLKLNHWLNEKILKKHKLYTGQVNKPECKKPCGHFKLP